MQIWQKYNFSTKDVAIWDIYEAYTSLNKKRGCFRKFMGTSTDPRNHKNWKYFQIVFEKYQQNPTFDPYIFIEAQYRNLPKGQILYPAQLKTVAAGKRYDEYRSALKISDVSSETEKIIINLAATFKFMKKWWKKHDKSMDDYKAFFIDKQEDSLLSDGLNYCIQGMISKYFLSVSRNFLNAYKVLDIDMKWEIIDPGELKSYRVKLKLDREAYGFAKEIFVGEIV